MIKFLSKFRVYRFTAYEFAFGVQFVGDLVQNVGYAIEESWEDYRNTVNKLKEHDLTKF